MNYEKVMKIVSESVKSVERLVQAEKQGEFKKQLVSEIVHHVFPDLPAAELSVMVEMAVAKMNNGCSCFGKKG